MTILGRFLELISTWKPAFTQERTYQRVSKVLMGLLAGAGRSTITNSILYRGKGQEDWSADYKAFNRSDWDVRDLFRCAFVAAEKRTNQNEPLVLAMDDTSLPKVGRTIPQARYCHNPLAPKFLDKPIMWGIRMIHAAIIIEEPNTQRPLIVSVAFEPVPAAQKPPKGKTLTEAEAAEQQAKRREASITTRAVDLIRVARKTLDDEGQPKRKLLVVVDGSYANSSVIGRLPHHTNLIGRFRKDAKLYAVLKEKDGKRIYGQPVDTPDSLRTNPDVPRRTAHLLFGGDRREIEFKEVKDVLWKDGSRGRPMRVLVVMPIPFRDRSCKLRYTRPAYLITTDLTTHARDLIQAYLHRWQIEVLHRDLKSSAGVGQVQVHSRSANDRVHGATVAAYAMLMLAAADVQAGEMPELPIWRRKPPMRISHHQVVSLFRNELHKHRFDTPEEPWKRPKGWVLPHRETYQAS